MDSLTLKQAPLMDGQIHRVATQDDKKGKTSGVYAAYNDGRPAGWYQDHRNHSEPQKWQASGQPANPLARLHLKAYMAQQQLQRHQAQLAQYAHHAGRVTLAHRLMPVAESSQGYLKRKDVKAYPDVKQDKHGRLVIPLYDTELQIKSIQRIHENGVKRLKKHAQKAGHFFVVGDQALENEQLLLYAEGYATAASIAQATGRSVIMTVDAGNMPKVAAKLVEKYPGSEHLFFADNDLLKPYNKGVDKAKEASELTHGFWVAPDFTYEEAQVGLTDFNDLHQSRGLAEVAKQINTRIDLLKLDNGVERNLRILNTIEPTAADKLSTEQSTKDKPSQAANWMAEAFIKATELKGKQQKQAPKPFQPLGYVPVNGKYYFANRPQTLAFVDKGNKLKTRLTHKQVIQSMLSIAQNRKWQQINISGSKTFKREAWYQASKQGIKVKGYRPNKQDLLRLKQVSQQAASSSLHSTDIQAQSPPESDITHTMQNQNPSSIQTKEIHYELEL